MDSIFQDVLVPPPAGEEEIGGDVFGRQPAADAKVPGAQALVQPFIANPAGSTWLHLDRLEVGANISSRVNAPDGVQQGGNGVCATASFVNIWAQDAPDAYARFATTLFDQGSADLAPVQGQGAGMRITASAALRAADYGAIVSKMLTRNYPVPTQADWMVLSAIRDPSNLCMRFAGDPDDVISHYLGDGNDLSSKDVVAWMTGAGIFSRVANEVDPWLGKTVGHAAGLDPTVSRCLLDINTKMFQSESGYHKCVLRSRVVVEGGAVHLRLWSWGRIYPVSTSVANFDSNYYGATIGYF